MARVLLINSSWDQYVSRKGRRINRAWPPLDLLNCAALLEQEGIKADLIDARAQWIEPSELALQAKQYDKVFVTSSPLDRWQCPNLEIETFFERVAPIEHADLFIMGVHGTQFPQKVLERTKAKAVIIGEPEWTVLDVARGTQALEDIPGLAFSRNNQLVRSPSRPLGDLKTLPIPAFHLLDWSLYGYELVGDRFAILETTRGCPFPCNFCQRDLYGGRAYRYKTPDQVGREAAAALASGARTGYFIDLEFSLNRDYTLQVCEALMPLRGQWTWCCQTRADSIDPELLAAMKRAGCTLIHFGVESGSPEVLKQTGKQITLDQVKAGVSMSQSAGIAAACFFMMGFPGETAADREMTVAFAKKLNPDYASFHIASPYPGTPLYAIQTWKDLYPESILDGADLSELKAREKKAYRDYYLRPGYLASVIANGRWQQLFHQAKLFWQVI